MQGIAQANSIEEHNGEIVIYGGEHGKTVVDAELNASSGKVHIDGNVINVNRSKINVSGDPAGEILIGGDEKGKHIQLFGKELPNASQTIIYPGSEFIANGENYGNGGKIVLWSDNITRVFGTNNDKSKFSVHGGKMAGKGGLIELSGPHLMVGKVSLDLGKNGTLRLDPYNVFLTNSATSGEDVFVGDPSTYNPNSPNANVSIPDIEGLLGFPSEVTVEIFTTGAGGGSQPGDITISAPISWNTPAGTGILKLFATRNIIINGQISSPNGFLVLSAGNVIAAPAFNNNFAVALQIAYSIISGRFGTLGVPNGLISALYSGFPTLPSPDLVYAKRFYPYDVAYDIYGIAQTENAMDQAYNDVGVATGGACGGAAY